MYNQLTEIPVPTSAQFIKPNVIRITSSLEDHVQNVKRTISKSVIVTQSAATSTLYQDIGDVVVFALSPSRIRHAVLREVKNEPQPKRYVEIWLGTKLEASMDVTEMHDEFYSDVHLSSLAFSPLETSLLYTAEEKSPQAISGDPYCRFRFVPHFGEDLVGRKRPKIFLFRWNSSAQGGNSVCKLLSISPSAPALFGQAIFSPDDEDKIYATGYEYTSDGRLLGIKFCLNRPSGIWEIVIPPLRGVDAAAESDRTLDCTARKLTPPHISCRSPGAFSYAGKSVLFWLSCPTGGAHASTSLLYCLDITPSATTVDQRDIGPPLVDSVFEVHDGEFPGLYPHYNLPYPAIIYPQTSSAPCIVTHSVWGSRSTVLLISTTDGGVKDLTPEDGNLYSWKVLGTDKRKSLICTRSTPIMPHELVLGEFGAAGDVSWRVIDKPALSTQVNQALSSLRASIIPIPKHYPTETIVIQSSAVTSSGSIRPLATIPHGGPHSTTTTSFSPGTVALALEGYTISSPNYTGSLGFGERYVRALLGHCGTVDVQDCLASVQHLVSLGIAEQLPGKQFLMGGSHGGFLVGHLIGQFPDMFAAAVLRNPVISVGEISTSDIPDWYYSEFGFDYPLSSSSSSSSSIAGSPNKTKDFASPIPRMSLEIFSRVQTVSPIVHVNNIRASVLILSGAADQRVAPTQCVEFYHALKARRGDVTRGHGKVEMLVFEGEGHSLDGVEAARVGWEAGRDLFASAGK